jgi:hypothetical protein
LVLYLPDLFSSYPPPRVDRKAREFARTKSKEIKSRTNVRRGAEADQSMSAKEAIHDLFARCEVCKFKGFRGWGNPRCYACSAARDINDNADFLLRCLVEVEDRGMPPEEDPSPSPSPSASEPASPVQAASPAEKRSASPAEKKAAKASPPAKKSPEARKGQK